MTTTATLKRTPFYDIHQKLGAKIVPFAGYEMPVQYPQGITAEHNAVRTCARAHSAPAELNSCHPGMYPCHPRIFTVRSDPANSRV